MRLLDLFCGAGGAAVGYHRAGFEVVGVDIVRQRHYPFAFVQADALTYPLDGFDVIHASPPCQDHSVSRNSSGKNHGTGWMLAAVLERFQRQGTPWVIENVVGAVLPSPIVLCGASFGLSASGMDLARHRLFQTSIAIMAPPCCHTRGNTIGVYGRGTNAWHRQKLGRNITAAEQREAMGIGWMTRDELTQAIPPAYTEYIGRQLLAALVAAQEEAGT